MTHRINGGRIHHLGAKVAKLHGLGIRQFVDGESPRYDAWVGRHKTVHIGPYFKCLSIEGCRHYGRRIVGASTPQVGGHIGLSIAGYKAPHHSHPALFTAKSLGYQAVGGIKVEQVLVALMHGFDKAPRVVVRGATDEFCHNERRQALAICHNGITNLWCEVLNKAHAMQNATQFAQQGIDICHKACLLFGSYHV